MAKVYTAQDMRERAEMCERYSDVATAEMLRQAADLMERDEKREKKYEYGVMSDSHCEGVYDSIHDARLKMDMLKIYDTESHLVRRPVGEWEEVRSGE